MLGGTLRHEPANARYPSRCGKALGTVHVGPPTALVHAVVHAGAHRERGGSAREARVHQAECHHRPASGTRSGAVTDTCMPIDRSQLQPGSLVT